MAGRRPAGAQRRHEPTDRLHELRRRPPSLLGGRALGAVRRRPDVAQHRARVRGPPRRHRPRGRARRPRRRPGRGHHLPRAVRVVVALRPLASRPAASRRATAWRSCSSRRWPSTPRSSAPSSGAPSRCRSSRCSARMACGSASRTARRGSSSPTPRRRRRRAASRTSTWSWPTTRCWPRWRAIPRATRCAAHRTTSPSSSTRPAPRASCPRPCGTRTGRSSCS